MSKWSSPSSLFKLSTGVSFAALAALSLAASLLLCWQTGWALWAIGLAVFALLVTAAALAGFSQERALLAQIEDVLTDASQGHLEKRVIMIPASHRLTRQALGVNDVLDQVEAVLRESLTVVQRMGEGDFSREPQQAGLRGIFPVVLKSIG